MSKRKRQADGDGGSSHKLPSKPKNVSVIESQSDFLPVVASTSGIQIPRDISFSVFQRKVQKGANKSQSADSELLLHTSQHPSLDYIVQEEGKRSTDSYLKYYVGIFDPARGNLQLVPAKKLVARSSLRPKVALAEPEAPSSQQTQTGLSARGQLGLAFGTKRSQKAIRNLTENAITTSPSKPAADGDTGISSLDAASQAVISSMAKTAASMPTRAELQSKTDASKPRPQPHLDASEAAQVYPVEELMGGEHVFKNLAVQDWIDKEGKNEDIPTQSLFVAKRLFPTIRTREVKKVKVLRYLLMLIEWFKGLKAPTKYALTVPKPEEMGTLIETYGTELIHTLRSRFSLDGNVSQWHQNYIKTHILALAMTVDDFAMDVHNIRQDLQLEPKALSQLVRELGCRLRTLTAAERAKLQLSVADAQFHKRAELKLPLEFPKEKQR